MKNPFTPQYESVHSEWYFSFFDWTFIKLLSLYNINIYLGIFKQKDHLVPAVIDSPPSHSSVIMKFWTEYGTYRG